MLNFWDGFEKQAKALASVGKHFKKHYGKYLAGAGAAGATGAAGVVGHGVGKKKGRREGASVGLRVGHRLGRTKGIATGYGFAGALARKRHGITLPSINVKGPYRSFRVGAPTKEKK